MQTELTALLARIEADNMVTADEVLQMRRMVWGDNHISVVEADALFRINENCPAKPVEWADFFITSLTDFLVRQTMPTGQIDDANAAWLMQRISQDGVVETQTELAMLINVLKNAENVTPRLEMFALEQVKLAVLSGKGILARGAALQAGLINEAEVELLRTVLYAVGGAGGSWITREEAELLFDLNDATAGAANHPSWDDLFCAAIANHLMMLSTPAKTNYHEAVRRDAWLSDKSGISWNLKSAFSAWSAQKQDAKSAVESETAQTAERITGEEAAWLIERLRRDGQLSPNEKKLLRFLRDDCPDVHDSLRPLIAAAA